MKIVPEKDIRLLHRAGEVSTGTGEKVNLAAKKTLSVEEQQARTIKQATKAVALSMEVTKINAQITNDNAATMAGILEKVSNLKPQESPKQVEKWRFDVSRNSEGLIKDITATAV